MKANNIDMQSFAQSIEAYYDVGDEHGYLHCYRGDIKNAVLTGAEKQLELDIKQSPLLYVKHLLKKHKLSKQSRNKGKK